jgi:hypothetical protein
MRKEHQAGGLLRHCQEPAQVEPAYGYRNFALHAGFPLGTWVRWHGTVELAVKPW